MVSNLRDMGQVMQSWLNEKPSGNFGNENELRLMTGDIAVVQFVANGDDGDRFIKIYRSHVEPRITTAGKRFNQTRYCPVHTKEPGVDCNWCAEGKDVVKERMSMWFYVLHHFHTQMPKDKQYPGRNYQGRNLYDEEVNGFKVWHSSAWKNSPWNSILQLYEIYHGLHNLTAQLEMTGSGTDTRYSIIALPNSPGLQPELYERAKVECEPIIEILHKELTVTPVQANPQQPPVQQAGHDNIVFQPFSPPGSSFPVFQLPTIGQPTENQAEISSVSSVQITTSQDEEEPPEPEEAPVTTPTPPSQPPVTSVVDKPNKSLF